MGAYESMQAPAHLLPRRRRLSCRCLHLRLQRPPCKALGGAAAAGGRGPRRGGVAGPPAVMALGSSAAAQRRQLFAGLRLCLPRRRQLLLQAEGVGGVALRLIQLHSLVQHLALQLGGAASLTPHVLVQLKRGKERRGGGGGLPLCPRHKAACTCVCCLWSGVCAARAGAQGGKPHSCGNRAGHRRQARLPMTCTCHARVHARPAIWAQPPTINHQPPTASLSPSSEPRAPQDPISPA
jgi:hypothetical protein